MNATRTAVLGTVGVVVLVSLVSGPLVPGLGVPEAKSAGDPIGSGNASVSVVSAPDTVQIREGGFDTRVYYLTVPDAELELSDVRGKPALSYELDVPEMNYGRSTVHFVGDRDDGPYSLSLQRDNFEPHRIDRDRYDGVLRIVLRADGTERVVYEADVRVEVSG